MPAATQRLSSPPEGRAFSSHNQALLKDKSSALQSLSAAPPASSGSIGRDVRSRHSAERAMTHDVRRHRDGSGNFDSNSLVMAGALGFAIVIPATTAPMREQICVSEAGSSETR
jgi:hypothetical protein